MSLRTIIITNIDTGNDHTYAGQLILDGESYIIQNQAELTNFQRSVLLNQHIWDSTPKVTIGDGNNTYTGADASWWLNDGSLRNIDGRSIVHDTPRKYGLITYFTGKGDDPATQHSVGGAPGVTIAGHHQLSDPLQEIVKITLNTIENETHVHEGYIQFLGARNDCVTLEIIPSLTLNTSAGSGTNYDLYGGYLIIPSAPGAGTLVVNDVDRVLVEVPINEMGDRSGAGYWDAEWNFSTKQFDNIVPNYAGTGQFNMFTVEVVLDRFMNHQGMLGDGILYMPTKDASMLGHNMRVKLTLDTVGADHEWWWNATLALYRRKTK
jgi:hypothetical protein